MPNALDPNIITEFGLEALLAMSAWIVISCGRAFLAPAWFASLAAYVALRVSAGGWTTAESSLAGIAVATLAGLAFGAITARATASQFAIASVVVGAANIDYGDIPFRFPTVSPITIIAVLVLLVVATIVYSRSRDGLASSALAQNERAAIEAGIDPVRVRVIAMAACAFIAGLCGVLSITLGTVRFAVVFGLPGDVGSIAAVVVGGARNLFGPVVGAAVMTIVGDLTPMSRAAIIGPTILLAATMFLPGGVLSLFSRRARA